MKVLLSWLREHVEVPVEPSRLAEDLSVRGLAVDGLEPRGDDWLLDLDITTNRVDCMNVYGVAREVATIYDRPLQPLPVDVVESGPPADEAWRVEIEAPDLCPRFCGRVLDVRVGPSPRWLQERLEAVGVRSISNVVDLSNYVMMEMGQPSHAFDLARLPADGLRVRWAREGERVTTLDGQDRALSPRVGVVAGPETPLALAGLMGGASSEVSDATRVIAVEAAYWTPLAVRRAARALGMHTEASHRFERGADPEAPPAALARLAHLAAKIGAGTVRPGLIDVAAAPRTARVIVFRPARASALAGLALPEGESRRVLSRLGFHVDEAGRGAWRVEAPSWRGDVAREADVVEEVVRHHGLHRIPSTLPAAGAPEGLRAHQVLDRRLREALAGLGLSEAITYSFVPRSAADADRTVALSNPLAEDQSVLRSSLVMPGLLAALASNLRHARRDVRLFEVGRVFAADGPLAREEARLGIALTGQAAPAHFDAPARPADVYDLKGLLETLVAGLGGPPLEWTAAGAPAWLHPAQSATLRLDGRTVGFAGALHPDEAARTAARDAVLVAELDLAALSPGTVVRTRPLPRFPAVERDVSFVVPAALPAAELGALVRGSAGPLLVAARLTARYAGAPIAEGRVSLTYTLVFQDPARTLTGDEVQSAIEQVTAAARARGYDIRGV